MSSKNAQVAPRRESENIFKRHKLVRSGYVNVASGTVRGLGGSGNAWSISVIGGAAYALDFRGAAVDTLNVNERCLGFPLRCLAD